VNEDLCSRYNKFHKRRNNFYFVKEICLNVVTLPLYLACALVENVFDLVEKRVFEEELNKQAQKYYTDDLTVLHLSNYSKEEE